MKRVKLFYMQGCPYCQSAERAIAELAAADKRYASVEIERIDENAQPQKTEGYDYWYVPSMFIDGTKVYEADPSQDYASIYVSVKGALDAALK